jgi:hypothetical protein
MFVRQNLSSEMTYQCSIPIDLKHFTTKTDDQLEDNSFLRVEKETDELIKELSDIAAMESNSKSEQVKQTPELILTFNIVFLTTPFTRSPIGILSLNDLTLVNYQHYIGDILLDQDTKMSVKFNLRGNKNYA